MENESTDTVTFTPEETNQGEENEMASNRHIRPAADAEYIGPNETVTFRETGKLPALRIEMKEELGRVASRIKEAKARLVRVASSKAALLEKIADEAEADYKEMFEYFKDSGV